MFSHIILGARDLDRQTAFYDAVLPHLGLIRRAAPRARSGPSGARIGRSSGCSFLSTGAPRLRAMVCR